MPRKVKVELDLDASRYMREARGVAVTTAAVDEEMQSLGRATDAAGRDMDQLAAQAEVAKKGIGSVGAEARDATGDLTALRARIDATKLGIKDMNAEWARTGDDKIRAKIRKEMSLLRDLERAAKDVEAEIQSLGQATDSAGRDMERFVGRAKVASHEVDGFGSRAEQAAAALALLDARIMATKLSVHQLSLEFARTGDASVGGNLDSERSTLVQLSRLRKDLVDFIEVGAKAGVTIGASVTKGIGASLDLGALKGVLMPALIGIAVAASPFIGAAIAGAVVGGVGLGGIAGGVIAAAHDDRVKKAWSEFTGGLTKESFGSEAFVGPVIEAIGVLKVGLRDLHLDEILGKGASAVPKLANALVAFAKGVLPGLSAALDHADEYAQIFGEGLAKVGGALGDMIKDFAESEGAMAGLRSAFSATATAIQVLGATITWLADRYQDLSSAGASVGDVLAGMIFWLPPASNYLKDNANSAREAAGGLNGLADGGRIAEGALHQLAGGTSSFGDAAWFAAVKVGDLTKAWDELNGRFASADEKLLIAKKGLQDVADVFSTGTKSVVGNSIAVLENRVALEEQARKAVAAAEAYLKLTGDAAGAAKILDDQRVAAEKSTKATGENAKAVHELALKLFEIPGLIPVVIDIQYKSSTASQIKKNLAAMAKLEGRASGGPVGPGAYWVGEEGPEVLELGAGQSGYVHSSTRSWKSTDSSSGWRAASGDGGGTSSTVRHIVDFQVNGQTMRSLLITDALNRNQSPTVVKVAYP